MNEKSNITAIILTKNEEKNILNCINSIKNYVSRIIVVDSYSDDDTIEIASSNGAEIYKHAWVHYADQFNWALDNIKINTKWIYRIDADEIVTKELGEEILYECKNHENDNVNGFIMKFRIKFLGKYLKHGGTYPFYNLTIFKTGVGRYENRAMGEHVVLNYGETIILKNDCLHNDFKDLNSWIDKHNKYSTREVIDYYSIHGKLNKNKKLSKLYNNAEMTKNLRDKIYYRMPLFIRCRLYYLYRYYFKLGFLDGKQGKIYAFLQAYWYRFLVDAKIFESKIRGNEL